MKMSLKSNLPSNSLHLGILHCLPVSLHRLSLVGRWSLCRHIGHRLPHLFPLRLVLPSFLRHPHRWLLLGYSNILRLQADHVQK